MSKYEVRVGDKVILRNEEWANEQEDVFVGSVYTVTEVQPTIGKFFYDLTKVQIDIFTKYGFYNDFELYQTNTKVTDVEIGDIVEVVVLDSLQLNAYPEMTKFLGKCGVVKDKHHYLDVKFDDEVDTAIWAIHYHCVRVVEKTKPSNNLAKLTVSIDGEQVAKQVQKVIDECVIKQPKPIQSDGGSSSYYDLSIPEDLLNKILERKKEGRAYIKTEEIIRYCLGNDFDKGNLFKSLVRIHSAELGFGKAGNSVEYDCNKIHYSADKIAQRNK